ncbi:hypothetical protein Cgig2_019704 [Carnegiea gigantea]|uniref:Uncharacterized protein n=1 Tax=Carnegiea gigantea TaxID=171969 RepID=A0A9Q1QM35_9CARY|nr:hypothetical protein Cgig2_019704 [Carnegiea gigantea]
MGVLAWHHLKYRGSRYPGAPWGAVETWVASKGNSLEIPKSATLTEKLSSKRMFYALYVLTMINNSKASMSQLAGFIKIVCGFLKFSIGENRITAVPVTVVFNIRPFPSVSVYVSVVKLCSGCSYHDKQLRSLHLPARGLHQNCLWLLEVQYRRKQFLCKGISKAIRIHASLAELMHVFKSYVNRGVNFSHLNQMLRRRAYLVTVIFTIRYQKIKEYDEDVNPGTATDVDSLLGKTTSEEDSANAA